MGVRTDRKGKKGLHANIPALPPTSSKKCLKKLHLKPSLSLFILTGQLMALSTESGRPHLCITVSTATVPPDICFVFTRSHEGLWLQSLRLSFWLPRVLCLERKGWEQPAGMHGKDECCPEVLQAAFPLSLTASYAAQIAPFICCCSSKIEIHTGINRSCLIQ